MRPEREPGHWEAAELSMPVPAVAPEETIALLNLLARVSFGRHTKIADLADALAHDDERLLDLLDMVKQLGFAETAEGLVGLSRMGRAYARAPAHSRKLILGDQLIRRIPLAAYVAHYLSVRSGLAAALAEIQADLVEQRSAPDAVRFLPRIVGWGRHLGIFHRDDSGRLSLARSIETAAAPHSGEVGVARHRQSHSNS